MSDFYTDILEQPQALKTLIDFYRRHWTHPTVNPRPPLLIGMGASFHAASIAALHLQTLNVPAFAVEATELLNYGGILLDSGNPVIYISQSGSSGEVAPILERLPRTSTLIALTNTLDSPLAQHAETVLNLFAGQELWVAAKTYVNSLAILWLLARDWGNAWDGTEFETLSALAGSCEQLIASADSSAWLDLFARSEKLIFAGHGPHAITARQAAMMAGEWAKVSILSTGIGAFRHGMIESVGPGTGAIIFAAPGPTYDSSIALAQELNDYGVFVLVTVQGQTYNVSEMAKIQANNGVPEFLAPILDAIPAQLFAEGLAQRRGVPPGFRYIHKVVTRL